MRPQFVSLPTLESYILSFPKVRKSSDITEHLLCLVLCQTQLRTHSENLRHIELWILQCKLAVRLEPDSNPVSAADQLCGLG